MPSSDHQQQSKLVLSDDEWKAKLSDEEYRVLRGKATEMVHTGQYNKHFEEGTYTCAGCGHPLYKWVDQVLLKASFTLLSSSSKFDSGCGWPAFSSSLDTSVNRQSTKDGRPPEITCASCGGHLGAFQRIVAPPTLIVHLFVGHIFDGKRYKHQDGRPIEERHCVNSVSLKFKRNQ